MIRIALERPDQPDVVALIDELDAYQKPLYPPESHYGVDIDALTQPNVRFAVARTETNEAVGCAAIVFHGDWAEVKRMFVRPAFRSAGVAQRLLAILEAHAREHGIMLIRLETGISQPDALRFYERAGFARRGRFGDFPDDPLSVYMEKRLAA